MPKARQNLLTPRPSDRLRVGECIVDLSVREIVPQEGRGEAARVTVKSQGVLMVLIANAGKVVSRETLLKHVWPDTMPNDAVINQAIIQLRKAFGESNRQNAYIETIAKQGYRLIAPIEWLVEREPPSQEHALAAIASTADRRASTVEAVPTGNASGSRSRVRSLAEATIAACLLALPIQNALWSGHEKDSMASSEQTRSPSIDLGKTYRRIVSTIGEDLAPSLSPDGELVVYVHSDSDDTASLMLQTTSPLPPKPFTAKVQGRRDVLPVWSPDGVQIAFVRMQDDSCSIMAAPVIGGDEREIGDCIGGQPEHVSWYPDAKALISAGQVPDTSGRVQASAIYRMPLDSGRWQSIPYPKSPGDQDARPEVSPDGRWIVFHRNGGAGDLWRMPSSGGMPVRLTRMQSEIFGLAWMPDSMELLFSRQVDGNAALTHLDTKTGRLTDLRLGDENIAYPSVSIRSGEVAFQVVRVKDRIRKLSVARGNRAYSGAETLFDSSGSNQLPALSPDGKKIVFVSTRTGLPRLCWTNIDDEQALRLIDGFVPAQRFPAVWDEASERILATGRGASGEGVYEIQPRSGRIMKLPVPEQAPIRAVYHPDTTRVLVIGNRGDGRQQLTLYDRSSRPWRALATISEDITIAIVDSKNHRILFGRKTRSEVWQADLALKNARIVDVLRNEFRAKTLSASSGGAWTMDATSECPWYWRHVPDASTAWQQNGICLGENNPARLDAGIGFDAVRGQIYLSTSDYNSYDIGYLSSLSGIIGNRPR